MEKIILVLLTERGLNKQIDNPTASPGMHPRFSLAHLTALELSPPLLVEIAASAGYDYVGLRLNQTTREEPFYDLVHDRRLMRETKARLADTGTQVWDIEAARMDATRDHTHYREFLEAGAELGAKHVITQLPDTDWDRATDRFAALCDIAKPLGLTLDLEFVAWWPETGDVPRTRQRLAAVNRSNSGMLIDVLHFTRTHSSLEDLRQFPREWITWIHVCDIPATPPLTREEQIHQGRKDRALVGEGGANIKGILDCLPEDVVYALEIPCEATVKRVGYAKYADMAIRAAERYLGLAPKASRSRAR